MARQVSELKLASSHSNPTNRHLAFNWVECFRPSLGPLLSPTPSHPDYPSTHATFSGAGSGVIRAYNNGSDVVSVTISSNVTLNNRGVITRTYTNLTEAAIENGESRVFGGIHFPFSSGAGIALGNAVALKTMENFDEYWSDF
jgi:membrane-associated phospholipid phosphatase